MKKKTKDYLRFVNIPIYQDDEMFCVNTDTVLLGMFLKDLKNKSVLDVGTNNGALLLYASAMEPKYLCGIDILEDAVNLARENLKLNEIKGEIELSKLQDFKHQPFDVIICNPPFFKEMNVCKNINKQIAMFEDNLKLDDLFKNIKRLLKDNGSGFMIYPANRFLEFYEICVKYDFKMMKIRFVYDKNKEEASRFLVKIKRGKMTRVKILKPILINDGKIEFDYL